MKRIAWILTALVLLTACLTVAALPAAAEAEFEMVIPYGKPTVDGVVNEGEYGCTYTMDQTTAAAWVGEVGDSFVVWHLAWDEGGLYYAGTINDSTPRACSSPSALRRMALWWATATTSPTVWCRMPSRA